MRSSSWSRTRGCGIAPDPVQVAAERAADGAARRGRTRSVVERADALDAWAAVCERAPEELASEIVAEVAKPIGAARDEVRRAVGHIRTASRWRATRPCRGQTVADGATVVRVPVGVVGLAHALEQPARAPRREDRPGPRLRQRRGLQAGARGRGHRPPAARDARRGRDPRRTRRDGDGRDRRRDAGRAGPARDGGRAHRVDGRGPHRGRPSALGSASRSRASSVATTPPWCSPTPISHATCRLLRTGRVHLRWAAVHGGAPTRRRGARASPGARAGRARRWTRSCRRTRRRSDRGGTVGLGRGPRPGRRRRRRRDRRRRRARPPGADPPGPARTARGTRRRCCSRSTPRIRWCRRRRSGRCS